MMRNLVGSAAAALMLAACGGGGAESNNAAEPAAPASLQPGEYELSSTVDDLRSTDNTTPATKLKVGGTPVVTRACVGAENALPPTTFAEAGEECKADEVYARNGRLSMQLRCNRADKGSITHTVDGSYEADSFKATVNSGTFFSGTGDYAMTRTVTAKRVGECTAAG